MRDIVFKELTEAVKKSRCVFLQEVFKQGKYSFTAKRQTIFRIKELKTFDDLLSANEWLCAKVDESGMRRMSLKKVRDTASGEESWKSKFTGNMYIMREKTVMSVAFIEIFSV